MNTPPDFGLHFIVGLSGTVLTDTERSALRELQPVGIILFRHNFAPENLVQSANALVDDARRAIGREQILVSIDHEGGRVHRLSPPVSHFPAAANWGDRAAEVANAMGKELRELGINLSFSPVVDIFCEPSNTVIGPRAFSSDPAEVARLGISFFQALEKTGVVACGKHFPGHGGTVADSHFELPVLAEERSVLDSREFVPFRALIAANIHVLMTGHIVTPVLDPDLPGSVSKPVIETTLRKELGFNGVVITDALEMRALQHLSLSEKAVLALGATTDILLIGQHYGVAPVEQGLEMARGIKRALENGSLNGELLCTSNSRVRELLRYSENIMKEVQPSSEAALGCTSHQALCDALHQEVKRV